MVRLMGWLRKRVGGDEGAVLVMVAAGLIMIFGVAALVLDILNVHQNRLRAQATVDAAVLAAAQDLPDYDLAVVSAKEYALRNFGITEPDWAGCADPGALAVATVSCISMNTAGTEVRVRLPARSVPAFFAYVLGKDRFSVSAVAEAISESVQDGGYAIFGTSPACASNYAVEVKGGSSIVEGFTHSNNNIRLESPITAPDGITYRTSIENEAGVTATQVPQQPDPLAHVQMTDYLPGGPKAVAAGAAYHDYTGAVITNTQVTGPGIYYTDQRVYLNSGVTFNATFIINNPTLTKSAFETNGSGYDLHYYQSDTANPDKLLVYTNAQYAEPCKAQNASTIHFNGSTGVYEGVLYAPNGGAHLNGSGSESKLIGSIVADTVWIDGTGNLLQNDGSFVPRDPKIALYK